MLYKKLCLFFEHNKDRPFHNILLFFSFFIRIREESFNEMLSLFAIVKDREGIKSVSESRSDDSFRLQSRASFAPATLTH